MNLRRVTRMIEDKWDALGFETEINGDCADMYASITHPAYGDRVMDVHIRLFDNAARHFKMMIGEVSKRYYDRAIEGVNTFNLKNPWLKAYIEEYKGVPKLILRYTGVGYTSLSDDEAFTCIMVAGDLMMGDEVARQMTAILNGEYL